MKFWHLAVVAVLCFSTPAEARRYRHYQHYDSGSVVGGRPAGCPYQFCGCGTSIYLFGKIIPELNLAINWVRKFPRVAPAPRMAAARSGHVMALVEHRHDDVWLVYDSNSGGHLTRLHERSVAGYVVVNPFAGS